MSTCKKTGDILIYRRHKFHHLFLITAVFLLPLSTTHAETIESTIPDETIPVELVVKPEAAPEVIVEGYGEDFVSLQWVSPQYDLETVITGDEVYQTLQIPGAQTTQEPGKPQLPVISVLVGVPGAARLELFPLETLHELVPGKVRLSPAPSPAPINEALQPGEWIFEEDPGVYQSDDLYPSEAVRFAGDAWFRDQRIVRIEFFPFQVNPADGSLYWNRLLRVKVKFVGENTALTSPLKGRNLESPFEPVLARLLVNDEQARQWRGLPSGDDPTHIFHSLEQLENGVDYYKILVEQDGIYRVSYADLLAAGMEIDGVNPVYFHLTSQGEPVAFFLEHDGDAQFEPGEALLFYGEKFRGDRLAELYAGSMDGWLSVCGACQMKGIFEKYTDANVYWLSVGDIPGQQMSTFDGAPGAGAANLDYIATSRAEESHRWFSYHFTNEDTWFWERLQSGMSDITRTYTTSLSALSTQAFSATVRASVVSLNTHNGHHTRFFINNHPISIDDAFWNGRTRYTLNVTIPGYLLVEGENSIHFNILNNGYSEDMYFDWFEIEYKRRFVAESDRLTFSYTSTGELHYQIKELDSAEAVVLDVSQSLNPVRVLNPLITPDSGKFTLDFRYIQADAARFIVSGIAAITSPLSVSKYVLPDLTPLEGGADYVFISHRDFLTSTQALADYRSAQGLQVQVVDVDHLYNQFNFGIYHPIAIRNYLANAFQTWQSPAPVYALLVGEGNLNLKNYVTAMGVETIYMPPNLAFVDPWQGEVDSTNLLAAVVGDDMMPDLAIGRLLARDESDVQLVLERVSAYELQPWQDWHGRLVFVADNIPDPAGNFEAMAENVINHYTNPAFIPDRIYTTSICGPPTSPPTNCTDAQTQIIQRFNDDSALIVNYIGHAALQRWAHEGIFRTNEIISLNNTSRFPVILSLDCLDAFWLFPNAYIPSLIEELLRSPGGGAIAAFSPGGLGVATGHDALHTGFYAGMFQDGIWDFGLTTVAAKLNLFLSGGNYDLLNTFTVFGDPALRLVSPYAVAIDPQEAGLSGFAGKSITYTLQITNRGVLSDTFDFSIAGNAWPVVLPAPVGPLASGAMTETQIVVEIPADITGGTLDRADVTVFSLGDRSKKATLRLATLGDAYGLQLRPVSAQQIGLPGSRVTYTLQITNTSNLTDTFNITPGVHLWDVQSPGTTPILMSGEVFPFEVSVDIPATAADHDFDTVMVNVVSQSDPLRSAISSLTSIARTYGVSLSPSEAAGSAFPGKTIIYTIYLENTGAYLETFQLSVSGNTWSTDVQPIVVGPLEPGMGIDVVVQVSVPATAITGSTDIAWLTAQSNSSPGVFSQARLVSTVSELLKVSLPVVIK